MDAQSDASTATTRQKAGNACLGCRRRKLKCSRDATCGNCIKADLPCIYDEQEPGLKRKRGPYKKDKSTREQHLEDVNRYLQSKTLKTHDDNKDNNNNAALDTPVPKHDVGNADPEVASFLGEPGHEANNPDDLVRNALNAITCTSPADGNPQNSRMDQTSTGGSLVGNISQEHLSYCFHIFQQRIDPVTKLLHWPTFMHDFYDRGGLRPICSQQEVLVHAICFIAISACSDEEVHGNLGAPRHQYLCCLSRNIEAALVGSTALPRLEGLQALLLYMTTLRRGSDDTSRWMFPLAVRMSQLIGLHRDPNRSVPPLEAEIRRRLWWALCNLESRSAEEGSMRHHSVMDDSCVSMPLSLNDSDLYPQLTRMPKEREGYSDVLLPKCRWELAYSTYRIWRLGPQRSPRSDIDNDTYIKAEQQKILETVKSLLQDRFFKHLDRTRRMDWLVLSAIEVMIVKAQILIDHPFGVLKACLAKPSTRMVHLRRAVFIIERTTALQTDTRCTTFHWFFRHAVQWHALAVVITVLSKSNDEAFCRTAWAALNPLLLIWDKLWESRMHEPAWQHVNALLTEAKLRRQCQSNERSSRQQPSDAPTSHFTQSSASDAQGLILQNASSDGFTYGLSSDQLLYGSVSPISFNTALSEFPASSGPATGSTGELLGASQALEGDPFATFDPQAFEEVFGSIDWDNIDPLLST
ncbi:hypothetical protein K431DRAFT_285172 [Polychaeton citri CBS 116435]|uniref:Zn(2)-C6 fungal-type domain-containing protein n=1 Tax=Polychaeton citri CBS 116435 TaxID=1314669 RepID=A0A9P4QAK7_9PEZI|nr:hypothetical protein K431DRAFT_285172 [Polychaeton citri CBS 116435]